MYDGTRSTVPADSRLQSSSAHDQIGGGGTKSDALDGSFPAGSKTAHVSHIHVSFTSAKSLPSATAIFCTTHYLNIPTNSLSRASQESSNIMAISSSSHPDPTSDNVNHSPSTVTPDPHNHSTQLQLSINTHPNPLIHPDEPTPTSQSSITPSLETSLAHTKPSKFSSDESATSCTATSPTPDIIATSFSSHQHSASYSTVTPTQPQLSTTTHSNPLIHSNDPIPTFKPPTTEASLAHTVKLNLSSEDPPTESATASTPTPSSISNSPPDLAALILAGFAHGPTSPQRLLKSTSSPLHKANSSGASLLQSNPNPVIGTSNNTDSNSETVSSSTPGIFAGSAQGDCGERDVSFVVVAVVVVVAVLY